MNIKERPATQSPKTEKTILDNFTAPSSQINTLFRLYPNYEASNVIMVFLLGVLFTPVTLAGSLLGFVRGYNRFNRAKPDYPVFYPMKPIVRIAMFAGAVFLWICVIIVVAVIYPVFSGGSSTQALVFAYLVTNFFLSGIVFGIFKFWQIGVNNTIVESGKFGTARFARPDELDKFRHDSGIYIGGDCNYSRAGHLLTVAGTRSGKFTNLIAPNLLGAGDIDGSWVVIDPKGEISSVTGKYQKEIGQNVVILNPWGLLADEVGAGQSYNPLDILDVTSIHLVDDCHMLAEMLVPVETGRNRFFSDSARAIVMGLILYIAVSEKDDRRSLKTLWKWVRYPQSEWDRILAEMQNYDDDPNGESLLFASGEIEKIAKAGGNTWGSVLATVLQATDFLKSPALQEAVQSGSDPYTLAHRNTTLYVIIPADKLQSHSRWLRLVVTSTMRAVIRKKNKRVCFILDEFAALGYLPEIEIALGTYAGFNITLWPILQSLVQLQSLYEKNWQVFVANSTVRHFFGIHNNFDADYISAAIGKTSHVLTTRSWFGTKNAQSTERFLITPDELRVESGKKIFTFIDDLPATWFDKRPYHEVKGLNDRAEKNPYLM